MKCNEAGLAIIEQFESLELLAYFCPAGKLTIGFGHTGDDVYQGQYITRERAVELLKQDVEWAEKMVSHFVKSPLTENQFSALVSFCFNVGAGNFSQHDMLKYLNAGEASKAADEFPKWNHCDGKVLDGLTKRRAAERALFLTV